ncbi:MAG: gluconate 2-dehydrogenase subunit 3 family protein [Acidobacteriaceae bacterium]|nr:gluconate 2-dehydrogenase subunit 3 family protein [Acidobacteriaceae bacterium]MBV9781027.1 gluconate 2-dehydrogenase subunit 3 family protein [Acidobacteriaceae bacterium]
MTRRDWMLSVGNAGAAFSLVSIAAGEESGDSQLPPGVFGPSTDHLSHALTPARFHAIPPGCPTDYVQRGATAFEPQFFSAQEFRVIRRVTELLLGEPLNNDEAIQEVAAWIDRFVYNSAGVRDAAQHMDPLHRSLARAYYGADELNELEHSDPQKICREGLTWLASTAQIRHGTAEFVSLSAADQIAMLDAVSDERRDKSSENPGTRLFALLKAQTVRGFYTSQSGLKELGYKGNGFYARSPGCDTK